MNEIDINQVIGMRIRQVRHIFNEGTKLSAEQFGHLLNETRDRIMNYELGRAAVPLRMLIELYNRGINPLYLLTGDGELFADNPPGRRLQRQIQEKNTIPKTKQTYIRNIRKLKINPEDYDLQTPVIKVAAGKIPKSSKES
jgi:hypothetical protein